MKNIEQRIAAVLARHFKQPQVNVEKLTSDLAATVAVELAGLELNAETGWARYEAANRMNRTQEKQIEALNIELTQEKAMLDFMVNEGLFACDIAGEYSLIATENDGYTHEIISGYECPRLAIQSAMHKLETQDKGQ